MQSVLIGTYTSGGQEKNGVWRLTLDSGRILDREGVLEAEDPSYLLPVDGGLYYVNERLSGGEGAVGYARKCGGHYDWKHCAAVVNGRAGDAVHSERGAVARKLGKGGHHHDAADQRPQLGRAAELLGARVSQVDGHEVEPGVVAMPRSA